jgi:hypothetical protein
MSGRVGSERRRADDSPHRADDDVGLPVDPLIPAVKRNPVIAAQRDDVHVVAGQRGELVLHRHSQPVQRPRQRWRHTSGVGIVCPGRDDCQRRVTSA